ncbi:MAG: PDZ domain-containing protein [Phycisphaerae bacterium]|nr:PDZ domain-containing protein [Phycisphaerae bacterium]
MRFLPVVLALSLVVPLFAERKEPKEPPKKPPKKTIWRQLGFTYEKQKKYSVREVMARGPADLAGVKKGYMIESVDSRPTSRMNPNQLNTRLIGEAGTFVQIVFFKPDGTPLRAKLERQGEPAAAPSRPRAPSRP